MKSLKNITIIIALSTVLFSIHLSAQERTISNLEKIYTQTDRPFYFPGETVWFKSYIVNVDNTIATLSDIMYAKLISPKGSIIKTLKLSISQGYAYGDFTIDKDWVGGIYKLKMFTNWMRNYGDDSFFTKKITIQKVVRPNALLSLEFEKEGYGKSSLITANFEAKDLKNNPISNSKLSYEVSIEGEITITKNAKTDNKGKANVTFQLPNDLTTRDVVLNILILHKGTTESISRSVPVVLDTIDLQFFPESGKLLYGTDNRIAFKAIDEFAKPVDIQGNIVDESGNRITSFDSFHDGMGAFNLNPVPSKTYYAKITVPFASEKRIVLPEIYKEGLNFNVTTDNDWIRIKIHSTIDKNLYLKVYNTNKLISESTINHNQEIVNLNSKEFPIGITKFKIADENNNSLAERLVFLNNHKQLNIDVTLDKEIYQTREKATMTITTTDENGNPIPSNISVAVADNKLLSFADDKQDHILSYLLLSSELKGKIHEPSFYFNPKEEKSYQALDYVMLTHGWRDYTIKPLSIKGAQYKPEQLTTQSGKIVDKKGNPIQASLLLFDQNGNNVLVFKSDKKGHFSFKFNKSRHLTLIAYTEDGQQLKIIEKEKIVEHTNNSSKNNPQNRNADKNIPTKFNNPTKQKVEKKATISIALSDDGNSLDEVVVMSYSSETNRKSLGASVVRVKAEELNSNEPIGQLLQGRAAGVKVVNGSGIYSNSTNVIIRGANSISGNNEPLIVVDGMPYDQEVLSNLNSSEVDGVTVLKNTAATTLYGCRGANGVIIITTKSQNFYSSWGKKKLNNAKYNNYAIKTFYNNRPSNLYHSKQFYIPKYEGEELPKERKDFRQTIYWNPIVQTDENGKAKFEFYNSDAITSFQILAEGIGYNGLIGRRKKEYTTKKILNVDFKSPNYMVLNDTVIFPVTITNETNKNIEALLNIQLPEELKLLESYKKNIIVKANNSTIEYIKVKPIKKAEKVIIKLNLNADNLSDVVQREATILSPYFPTKVSVSDSKPQSFEFSVDNLVEGSLNADFTIYTDIIGDVMDGIEGMIRQPYGCFEQTSSATYPNIMVLKYLKETDKNNPEIESRALNFIKEGYKKLISFETKKGGFEWFGNTPPHETLTAYGILEFIEMKEVFKDVNQKMIDRTVDWLLSRRDGKGGFNRSNEGYDSFASSPNDVANAYIVYALSESGINVDIEKEYEASFKDAIKSNDTYKMALMACASFNVDKNDNAKKLITKIKENIEVYNFSKLPVENTITRSYGESKNIETVAFSLLALLRENNPDEFLISQGIEYLVGKRKYNRFGSTQSTSMALKALIEYTKTQKAKLLTKDNSIQLKINDKSLSRNLSISENGKIVIDNLETYMAQGKQNLSVQFSNPEIIFPYSLNINYDSSLPQSSMESPLGLETLIVDKEYNVGDNVSMTIKVTNKKNEHLGMVTSVIGIPSGTTPQPWQLKKLTEENKVAYYEIFDNYLVFYWRAFKSQETKNIRLDLKADISGNYQAPASMVYPYYGDEFKIWISGSKLKIN